MRKPPKGMTIEQRKQISEYHQQILLDYIGDNIVSLVDLKKYVESIQTGDTWQAKFLLDKLESSGLLFSKNRQKSGTKGVSLKWYSKKPFVDSTVIPPGTGYSRQLLEFLGFVSMPKTASGRKYLEKDAVIRDDKPARVDYGVRSYYCNVGSFPDMAI
jgi:hypothetical protein